MIKIKLHKALHAAQGEMLLDLNLEIEQGTLVAIYGPSGAGKTSTLKILSGLLQPDSGMLSVNDNLWFDTKQKINLKPQQRNVGYLFQDYALFPNMTVLQNLAFALSKKQDRSILQELIEMMELGELQDRKPATLSGGQKQRVALARALVQRPQILLLDEPLSALDRKIRSKLQNYILSIHRKYNLTTILISHDIGEIHKLADKVIILENGQVAQEGTPTDIFINQKISGKFKFTGEVLNIEQEEVVYIVTVLIQNQIVKVIAQSTEIEGLKIGDQVMVASKAFNPIIYKID